MLPDDEITVAELAKHYGKSVRTIQRAIASANVRPIGRGSRARLTPADVLAVREALRRPPTRVVNSPAGGRSMRDIGRELRREGQLRRRPPDGRALLTRADFYVRTGWSPDKLARILRENPTLEVVGAGRGMQFTEQQFAALIAAATRRGTCGKSSTRQAPERATGTGLPAGRTRMASATRSTSARRTRELLDGLLGSTKGNATAAIGTARNKKGTRGGQPQRKRI
jgi:hypothetical protein